MSSPCQNLHPFADAQLNEAEHRAFERHLGGCDACARGLEEILVLGALADEARSEQAGPAPAPPVVLLLRRSTPWWHARAWYCAFKASWGWAWSGAAVATAALAFFVLAWRGPAPEAVLLAELQARPYRTGDARLAVPELGAYRPLSRERGEGDGPSGRGDERRTRQQALAALEGAQRHHLLGALYLTGQQYGRAARALAQAPTSPEVLNDRAVLALQQGHDASALATLEQALAAAPALPAALWNRALALESLGRLDEAARAFEACAARNEPGWSAEAATRAAALRGKLGAATGEP